MARTTGERGMIVSNSNLTNFKFEVQRGEVRHREERLLADGDLDSGRRA
jgi:hypothetical protein